MNNHVANRLKYPAVTKSWRTFPGAKLMDGWGLEVVGVECD